MHSLDVTGGTLTPAYAPSVSSYTVEATAETVTINYTVSAHASATYTIDAGEAQTGNTITVTGEAGDTVAVGIAVAPLIDDTPGYATLYLIVIRF